MGDDLITTGDVARALGVTINTVKAWARGGKLESIRLPSGHYRIPRRELERLLRADTAPSDYRSRLRQWHVVDVWNRAQAVENLSIEDALTWVETMLELARAHGPLVEPSVEATAYGVARLHAALAHVHR